MPPPLASLVPGLAAGLAAGHLALTDAYEGSTVPQTIRVSEAPQEVLVTNGAYDLVSDTYNGHQCYKKQHVQLWLCYDSHRLWNFQPKSFMGTSQGIMVSTQKGSTSPINAGPWRVWKEGKWVESTAKITDKTPFDLPQVSPEESLVQQTIAGILGGMVLLVVFFASLTGSMNGHIRTWSYWLVSTTCSFLIALLVVQAVWDLLMKQILTIHLPGGFGLPLPIRPWVKIIVSSFLFVSCMALLNFIAWKVQFRRSRLMVIKTLGAHITATVGMTLFTLIQREVVSHCPEEMNGLPMEWIGMVLAASVVALAWATFLLCRWAGSMLRREKLRFPPTRPWPADMGHQPVPSSDRSCMVWGATAPQLSGTGLLPWGHAVEEAEDEAATVVIGFLASQTIMHLKTQELPGFKDHYDNAEVGHEYKFFGITILILVVLFSIVLVIRSFRGAGGRIGKLVQRSIAMATTWILYRASCWNARVVFEHNRPLALVMSAILITLVSGIFMLILDRFLDFFVTRNTSLLTRDFVSRLNVPGEPASLEEATMRAVISCVGLVIALAWQINFEASVRTVARSQDFMSQHVVIAQSFITAFVAMVLFLPWRRVILPKGEMNAMRHADEISNEMSVLADAENFTR